MFHAFEAGWAVRGAGCFVSGAFVGGGCGGCGGGGGGSAGATHVILFRFVRC